MRQLPNLTNTPPGGWWYKVPETGKRIPPVNGFAGWKQLKDVLAGHYQAAGYDLPKDIFDKVVEKMCDEIPEYCGEAPKPFLTRIADSIKIAGHTFNAAHQCLAALVSHRAGSGERPSQELVEARAKTCVECEYNTDIQKCSFCSMRAINNLVEKLVGTRKTQYDAQLKYCAVCHCNLRAKISTKHDAIWNHMPNSQKEKLPPNCWLITEAQK